jgi:twinkle protein
MSIPTRPGKYRCPECSDGRRNKHDKSLSVHYDRGSGELFYKCHHCQIAGKVGSDGGGRINYTKPSYNLSADPTDKLFEWFLKRGIPPSIVIRHKISSLEVRMPQTQKNERVIAFPYLRGGEVINVKYRTAEKLFRMESGAELTFYGLDDIDPECVVIVEGEIDKLSVERVGFTSCISVPNGAGTNLDILASAEQYLEPVKKFVIAGDSDLPGRKLQGELIRRIGPERCCRVEWPEGCKDANEVLLREGENVLRRLIETAPPVPIEGVFEVRDVMNSLIQLYHLGRPPGMNPGWKNLDELYKPRPGQWSVVTGSPGSGKSTLLRAMLVNLAMEYNLQFLVFPPEDSPPEEYISQLTENYLGLPFDPGPTTRMTEQELIEAADWVEKHFVILDPPEGKRDLGSILDIARAMVFRRGINGIVIDPWNEIEHQVPAYTTETQYIHSSLVKIRSFNQLNQTHTWIVVHPTKLQKVDGKYPVATLYDCAGSAAWHNKADFGISVFRDKTDDTKPVEIHVQKVRSRWCGQLGLAELYYYKPCGTYSEHRPDGSPRKRTETRWLPYADDDDMEPIG